MKKLFVDSRGNIVIREAKEPKLEKMGILSKTKYSLISSGTESGVLIRRRKNPKKKGDFLALGYSNSGIVVAKHKALTEVKIGDLVACAGGGYASHSEICYVPKNLFVKCPKNLSAKEACFVAIGSIAMHGVRRCQVSFGEKVVVMGLGIIGQIVAQILRIAGAEVIATDFIHQRLELAKKLGAEHVFNAQNIRCLEEVKSLTNGFGADAVIVCANNPNSSAPIKTAIEMVRDKGRIVVVGDVKLTIERGPLYAKEVDLLISRSYGPGRYDPNYEENGQDYPVGFVRWTENRNMEEFLRLISVGKINVKSLITHEYDIDDAPQAFETILNEPDKVLGVILRYNN